MGNDTQSATRPVCVGTGLIALDIIMDENKVLFHPITGGSCANVLIIMSYLGWNSYPIGQLGNDDAGKLIMKDFLKQRVNTEFVYYGRRASTPVIIERLHKNKNVPFHKFEFSCPRCKAPLPHNRAISSKVTLQVISNLPKSNVFYFDRASKSALKLANVQRELGALIIFEPSIPAENHNFLEAVKVAHIVKYSDDKLNGEIPYDKIPIEIQTLGNKGLRYRITTNKNNKRVWRIVPPFPSPTFIDSAGAGDWVTAGIINTLGRDGSKGINKLRISQIEMALKYGQALAAIKCGYLGPRTIMYKTERTVLETMVRSLLEGKKIDLLNKKAQLNSNFKINAKICKRCSWPKLDLSSNLH